MPKIRINSQVLTFNNIYYVDSTKGLDTNNGSISSPFLTVNYAVSKCATTGDAIFALAGTHNVTRIAGTYDSGGLWDDNKAISFIGEKGKTIFVCDGTKHSGRDTHCIMFKNAGTKAYQITFDYSVGNRTNNYSTSICGIGDAVTRGEVINCLFKIISPNPNFSYSNAGTSITKFTNCTFDVTTNFVGSYSGSNGITLENCVTNFSFYSEGIKKNIYDKVSFNPKYHVTNLNENVLDIGIYSGDFNWTLGRSLLHSNNKAYSLEFTDIWYNTKMTSDTSPSPLMASASRIYGTAYPAWKAFDNELTTSWLSLGNTNEWLTIDLGTRKQIDSISIQGVSSAITTSYLTTATPKNMRLQGSNDNIVWDDLHVSTNLSWTKEEIKTFSFPVKKYQYIRIFVETNNGAPYIGISEVRVGFSGNGMAEYEMNFLSIQNFVNYGKPLFSKLNQAIGTKNYILQEGTVSEHEQGFWIKKLGKKPLSISFD
ncbi:discoidin domain-containing protein [Lysinibacillus cavernae]|uniref:discoidin domain-containing protein n=1 Tax=Lysinibacillus cavernae TaxID=2666135 RepID=UPI0012D9F1E6|nr:discoidin domain-containing protein [Lysinibacillus cavernae]